MIKGVSILVINLATADLRSTGRANANLPFLDGTGEQIV